MSEGAAKVGEPFLTFMVAFAVMCSGITSASSAAVAFGATYLAAFVKLPTVLVGIAFVVLLALINFRGVGESVKANVVPTCIELSGLLIIVGVWAVLNGDGEPSRLVEIDTADKTWLVAISSATSLALYGLSNKRVLPPVFGRVHPTRRTPWVSIIFTSVIAIGLASFVDTSALGGTTALLLFVVFAIVNIALLVLRKDKVPHKHFRAPTAVPVLAAIFCLYLVSPLSGRPAQDYRVAGILLWVVNLLVKRALSGASSRPEATRR